MIGVPYKTTLGLRAVIAQVKTHNGAWVMRGSVKMNGVYYMHCWTANGRSASGCPDYDLMSTT